MDLVAIGYPSALTSWAFSFLEHTFRRIVPDLSVVRVDRYDTLVDKAAGGAARLILSMFPNPAFAEATLGSGSRCVIFADDIAEAVRYVRSMHKIGTAEALRPVSAGLVLARPFAQSPSGLIIGRDLRGSTHDILRTLLDHFQMPVSDELVHRACREVAFEDLALSAKLRRESRALTEVSDDERHMIVQALGGLRQHLDSAHPADVTWPRQCFLLGDHPNSAAPVAIDVTGRARIIFYGPYLHLPRGRWRVRATMGFSQDIRGMPFSVEVHSTELIGKARIFAERGGIFEFAFEATVTAPHEPIEVRIMNEQGAIEGHMGLVAIGFQDWQPLPDETPLAAQQSA